MARMRFCLFAALLALWYVHIARIASDRTKQWDFPTYYYAARAVLQGRNPYDLQVLSSLSGGSAKFRWLYPMAAAYAFVPFTYLPFEAAYYLWLAFKLGCLAMLAVLWRRVFLTKTDFLLYHGMLLLSFNGTLVWDLKAGNIGIIEQLLLWLSFYYYIRGSEAKFIVALVVASLFKLTPLCFLVLLITPDLSRKRRAVFLAAALLLFGLLALGPYIFHPDWFPQFLQNVLSTRERGATTPCFLALCDDFFTFVPLLAFAAPQMAIAAYGFYLALILALSYRRLRSVWRSPDRLQRLMTSLVLYAMLVPRLKCYSYGLVIVPALLCIEAVGELIPAKLLLAYLFLLPQRANAGLPQWVGFIIESYYPWILLAALWVCWLRDPGLLCGRQSKAASTAVTQSAE